MSRLKRRDVLPLFMTAALAIGVYAPGGALADSEILNVSYDPTRELYQEFNAAFAAHWKQETGEDVTIKQSHGGSGKQARAVIDGLEADVVTLALAYDIDAIAERSQAACRGLADAPAAQQRALHLDHRVPGAQGQPEGHQGLGRPGQGRASRSSRRTRRPRAARAGTTWPPGATRLQAARRRRSRRRKRVRRRSCIKNVPVLDTGARGSTTTFVQRGIGDVLLAWENEAFLAVEEFGPDKFEIVVPSLSILAEPPVALVDKNVDKHGTREVAEAYLEYLYRPTRPGDRRQALLPAARPEQRRPGRPRALPRGRAGHHRRGLRRLAEGAGQALRRRRRVRPDLPARSQSEPPRDDARCASQRLARPPRAARASG